LEIASLFQLKIALVHHWLVTMRGGERVLEALGELFPSADLFTLVYDRSAIPASLRNHQISSSLLQHFPNPTAWYRHYLPFFPIATRHLDVTGYDLIISSDAAVVKGVRSHQHATHICYCHSPMRYVWSGYDTYYRSAGPIARRTLSAMRSRLCKWDYEAAQRVTYFVANSRNVQRRIKDCYGRDSVVIYPPVNTDLFSPRSDLSRSSVQREGNYFLLVSQLVPYKRIDLVVETFNRCGRPLVIVGDGPERKKLEKQAALNIRFAGSLPQRFVVRAMQQCRAFVFAGEEDFGIVMAEAQACGKPAVAFGRGGATEIVDHGVTGILFQDQTVESLLNALEEFDRTSFDASAIRLSALRFARPRFLSEFGTFVRDAINGS
jgi:glycosyltransferase involved in cell wall biosynthesis